MYRNGEPLKKMMRKLTGTLLLVACLCATGMAQTFLSQQLQYPVFQSAFEKKDSVLRKEFEAKGLHYPAHYIYLRSFKYDSYLEVWVKSRATDTFALFKRYPICALSGTMGPKRREGDRQVPEGFYFINEFNPRSAYHLALGLNYPNFSDRSHGDRANPGNGIYIHGSCVTEGCIPLTNPEIDEVYVLAVHARNLGQNYIPVHIFPVQFNNKGSVAYLDKHSSSDGVSQQFWLKLKEAYDDFNANHRLPLILFDEKGNYLVRENNQLQSVLRTETAGNSAEAENIHMLPLDSRGAR
jgi:murein L,D-transpeptidase YafK